MTKLLARLPGADLGLILETARELGGGDVEATVAGRDYVEVTASGVTKHAAVARLAADRGLPAEEVVAFGDHLTDVGMVAWAGLGVAVANATPAVLEVADVVTASNNDDGVALVLERLVGPAAQPISSASVGA
jgi:hydroxymethylpyrimidine pyrophosphatase-like HAD family hydrolase